MANLTVVDESKDKQLNELLVDFRIGNIDIRQARFKISRLFSNELVASQDISNEDWE